MNKKTKIILKSVVLLVLFSISINALAVWVSPTSLPVGNNTNPPVNIGLATQQKNGGLVVGGFRSIGPAIFDTSVDVTGILKIISGNPGLNKVLTSDANGVATWQTPASGGSGDIWTRTGTHVTLTNLADSVGLGTATPNQQFEITKSLAFPDTTNSSTGVIYKGANRFIHNYGNGNNNNTFVGIHAGNFSMTGNGRNSGFGFNTLNSLTSGIDNTAVGWEVLKMNTTGGSNTGLGRSSLDATTTGSGNSALGVSALYKNTSGGNNTAVGNGALYNNTTGNNNTGLGTSADVGSGNLTNATAIGFSANVTASNTMVFGNDTVAGWGFGVQPGTSALKVGTNGTNGNGARLTVGGVWTNASDKTKKHDITNLSYGLNEIIKLRPVEFSWNDTNKRDMGLIAQEVKEVMPNYVVYGNEGDMTVAYSQLTIPLIKAVQDLKTENDLLKKRIELLEAKR